MSEFTNKVVIVTGASSGIGAGTAVEYAQHGARLVLAGRNKVNLKKTAEECQQKGLTEDKIILVQGDLTKEDDCNSLIDKGVEKFGEIDILVNNAGSLIIGSIETCTPQDMNFMYQTHVMSTFIITKRAVPHLIKTKGSIVNVSSITGTRPMRDLTAYSVAKAAVNGLTQTLAQDLAPKGVNVNCITPGIIKTGIFTRPGSSMAHAPDQLPEFYEELAGIHPLGRVGNVQEVAQTIVFLTSNAASFITGAVVPVDGGRHGTYMEDMKSAQFPRSLSGHDLFD